MSFLVRGVLIGLAFAATIGPMSIICIQRTLRNGYFYGLISSMGVATACKFRDYSGGILPFLLLRNGFLNREKTDQLRTQKIIHPRNNQQNFAGVISKVTNSRRGLRQHCRIWTDRDCQFPAQSTSLDSCDRGLHLALSEYQDSVHHTALSSNRRPNAQYPCSLYLHASAQPH